MDLPWNRIEPLLTVPYLPTLGAMHPGAMGSVVWAEVLGGEGTGCWLPYDKDARWGGVKSEFVIDAVAGDGYVLVVTLIRRGAGTVKVHCYGPVTPEMLGAAKAFASHLIDQHQAGAARLVWFLSPGHSPQPGIAATRVQLRTFNSDSRPASVDQAEAVTAYTALPAPVAATFADFAATMADDGFAFLHQRMLTDDPGPVLTVTADHRVVGAIGPMVILADPTGRPRLLPQYFGVLPTHRGRGLGRALWRAAMAWGADHGADYQILNTVVDGPSDRLCRTEGLTDLGIVCVNSL